MASAECLPSFPAHPQLMGTHFIQYLFVGRLLLLYVHNAVYSMDTSSARVLRTSYIGISQFLSEAVCAFVVLTAVTMSESEVADEVLKLLREAERRLESAPLYQEMVQPALQSAMHAIVLTQAKRRMHTSATCDCRCTSDGSHM